MTAPTLLRQALGHSAQYGAASLVSRAASLLIVPIYTRVLTPSDYGQLDLLVAFGSLVQLTAALEVSQGLARHYADADSTDDRRILASTSLWFSIAAYTAFLALAIALATPLSELVVGRSAPTLIVAAGIWIFTGGLLYLILNQLRWMLDPRGYAIASVLGSVASIGFSVALVVAGQLGVVGVLLGGAIGNVLGLGIAFIQARSVYALAFSFERLRQMLSFSLPLVPSGIAVFVTLYVDRIAISRLMTTADVGLFGIGYRLAAITSLLIIGFQAAITPIVYQRYREPEAPAQLAAVFRAFVAVALGLSLGLAMFADEIMRIFTTPPFYGSAAVVPLLAPALVLSGMYVLAPGLAIARRTGWIALVSVGGALLNTILNLLFIPVLGIQGAALATFTGAASMFAAYMILSQRLYPVPHRWGPLALGTAGIMAIFAMTRVFDDIAVAEPLAEVGGLVAAAVLLARTRLIDPASIVAGVAGLGRRSTR